MVNWIRQINLQWAFLFLLAFHGLLYYTLQTPNWYIVALTASLVDIAVVAALQLVVMGKIKGK